MGTAISPAGAVNLNLGRGAVYEYFYMVFSGIPDRKFIGLSSKFAAAFARIAEENASPGDMPRGAALLAEYALWESENPPEKVLDKFNTEYTSLYLLGFSSAAATESVNRTAERLNRQEPWEKVKEIYLKRGFKMPEGFREPEDHMAAELLFMSRMCRLASDLFREGLKAGAEKALKEQADFLRGHLGLWAGAFCADTLAVARRRKFKLYEAAAVLLESFIETDKAALEYQLS